MEVLNQSILEVLDKGEESTLLHNSGQWKTASGEMEDCVEIYWRIKWKGHAHCTLIVGRIAPNGDIYSPRRRYPDGNIHDVSSYKYLGLGGGFEKRPRKKVEKKVVSEDAWAVGDIVCGYVIHLYAMHFFQVVGITPCKLKVRRLKARNWGEDKKVPGIYRNPTYNDEWSAVKDDFDERVRPTTLTKKTDGELGKRETMVWKGKYTSGEKVSYQ